MNVTLTDPGSAGVYTYIEGRELSNLARVLSRHANHAEYRRGTPYAWPAFIRVYGGTFFGEFHLARRVAYTDRLIPDLSPDDPLTEVLIRRAGYGRPERRYFLRLGVNPNRTAVSMARVAVVVTALEDLRALPERTAAG